VERLIKFIDEKSVLVNQEIERLLPKAELPPATLHEAMRYSVIGGGKRIRPLLVLMCCQAGGGEFDEALSAACALEFVHSYSLIHDDLPAMDNDDMRRGRLTCHKAYDEATAILAGDALLTLAFEIMSGVSSPKKSLMCVKTLARAAGSAGMVGGQMMDLEAEGKTIEIEDLEIMHRRKTGALIAAACRIGGIIGGAESETLDKLCDYGRNLGLLFQITDDILDETATAEELGKTPGKDAKSGKMTYTTVYGREEALNKARELAAEATASLHDFGAEALMPRLLVDYILQRKK